MKRGFENFLFIFTFLFALIFGLSLAIFLEKFVILLGFLMIPTVMFLLLNPKTAFLLALFFLPAHNLAFDFGVQIEIYYIFLLLSLIGFFAQTFIIKRSFIKLPHDNFLFVFGLIAILSSAVGYIMVPKENLPMVGGFLRGPEIRPLIQIVKLWLIIGSYFLTINLIRDKKTIINAINVLLLSVVSVSLYGVYQFIGFYLQLPFVMGIKEVGLTSFRELPTFEGVVRVSSYAGEPKFLAAFLLPMLILMTIILYFRTKEIFWGKLLQLRFLLLLSFVLFILTLARGAWIALAISLIVLPLIFTFYVKRFNLLSYYLKTIILFSSILIILTIGITMILGTEGINIFINRFSSIDEIFSQRYLTNIEARFALEMIEQYPILGIGLGTFTFYYLPYHSDVVYTYNGLFSVETVPNWFLSTLVETGIFGLLFLTLFIVNSIRFSVRTIRIISNDFYKQVISAFLALSISYLIYSLYIGGPQFVFFFIFGILKASVNLGIREGGVLAER